MNFKKPTFRNFTKLGFILCLMASSSLVGCGGGKTTQGGTVIYSIGGNVTGLSGSVVLQNNLGNNITVSSNGAFTFPAQSASNNYYSQVVNGSSYDVSVLSQPNSQTCLVTNGSGTIAGSNVINVTVNCGNYAYNVGGMVTGVSGVGSVDLLNTLGSSATPDGPITVSTDGSFTFPTPLASGDTYNATISSTTNNLACSVSAGAGTVSLSNVSNISVICSAISYTVGATISGLSGSETVVLQNNSGNTTASLPNGLYTFSTPVADGSPYNVTVLTPPSGKNCSVANGTGTIAGGPIANVTVTCAANTYTIAGTTTGLNGTLVLQDTVNNTSIDNLNVYVNGSFTFASAVASGSSYSVSASSVPSSQSCTVNNASGVNVTSNIRNVAVACRNLNTIIGGSKQGNPLSLSNAVSTFSGTGSTGSADNPASFNNPRNITSDGTNLYVADTLNNTIRKIVIATGVVSTLAGSGSAGSADNAIGTLATFNNPYGITNDGTYLYVADTLSNKIRMIDTTSGTVTTLAGSGAAGSADNGTGTSATFNNPYGITNDANNLYVADTLNNKIRVIGIAPPHAVSTIAGSGTAGHTDTGSGTVVTFNQPWGLTTDGTNLYVADTNNHLIRKIVISSKVVSTLAGIAGNFGSKNSTTGTLATFDFPRGITTDGTSLYVADSTNQLIRKVVISNTSVTTLAGTANTPGAVDSLTGTSASFKDPSGITTDGVSLFVADTSNRKIRQIK